MTRALSPSRLSRRARTLAAALALTALTAVAAAPAEARVGGGFSSGSRGTRTFSTPPSTATAPRAAPFQRTEAPSVGAPTSGFGGAALGSRPRFGFGSGLAAGLFGAGLIGLLTGHGFFGGIGGLFSFFGTLLQLALIAGLAWLALNWFRNRAGSPAYASRAPAAARSTLGGLGGMGLGAGSRTAGSDPAAVGPQDFAAFERMLSDIQHAYGREDFSALARLTTPEMLRHLGADIEANQRQNQRNDLSDVRLIQGDLAESWREGAITYATVAMRFALRDVMLDRASGRVTAGDPDRPIEVTEIWTFRRASGKPWLLSAIQQTN